jgi:hypothetical protein
MSEELPVTTEVITQETYAPIVGTNVYLNPEAFNFAQRVAKMFASSTFLPECYKGNLPNCLIAFNLANRLQIDPFTLMQNSAVVHGKPGLEGKLYIALLRDPSRSPFAETFDISYEGSGDKLVAIASGIHKGTGNKKEKRLSIEEIKSIGWYAKNDWWKKIPEQMLGYRVASLFCKLHCPEVSLGLMTLDELQDTFGTVSGGKKRSTLNDVEIVNE